MSLNGRWAIRYIGFDSSEQFECVRGTIVIVLHEHNMCTVLNLYQTTNIVLVRLSVYWNLQLNIKLNFLKCTERVDKSTKCVMYVIQFY